MLSKPNIAELTVEDPAEAFEDLRDRNDLRMLLGLDKFIAEGFGDSSVAGGPDRHGKGKGKKRQGKMGPPVERAWAEKWRANLKIAGVRLAVPVARAVALIYSTETIQSPR